jgi:hypothetical protein
MIAAGIVGALTFFFTLCDLQHIFAGFADPLGGFILYCLRSK